MTLIAVDCGSSRIKAALFKDKDVLEVVIARMDPAPGEATFAGVLSAFLDEFPDARDARVVLCAVAHAPIESLLTDIADLFDEEPHVVSALSDHGLIVTYDPPSALGVDRLADCVGAVELHGAPCIAVDFGTATTINVVIRNKSGHPEFIGGAICAGFDTVSSAFASALPSLPGPHHSGSTKAIGASTADGITSGLIIGHAAMVDGLIQRMKKEMGGHKVPVIATGGRAELIAPHCDEISEVDPILTLRGIRAIALRSGVS